MAGVQGEIEAAGKGLVGKINAKDFGGLANMYTETCVLMAPGNDLVQGRAGVKATYDKLAKDGFAKCVMDTEEVVGSGDTAAERGTYKMLKADGSPLDSGRYVLVWRKVGGQWLVHYDINRGN